MVQLNAIKQFCGFDKFLWFFAENFSNGSTALSTKAPS